MIKKVIYENSLGKMIFDGRKMYCQSIDCNGNSVSSTTEQLFNSHGQRTISRYFNAKTIPCSFLLADLDDNHALRQRIVEILNPIITGTLTVQTEHGTYSIDCYPSESSSFKRSEVNYCYLWNVDFVAVHPPIGDGDGLGCAEFEHPPVVFGSHQLPCSAHEVKTDNFSVIKSLLKSLRRGFAGTHCHGPAHHAVFLCLHGTHIIDHIGRTTELRRNKLLA